MQATLRPMSVVILLLIAGSLPLLSHNDTDIELSNVSTNFQTIISVDTVWNGDVSISDNVTVSHGVKLTVKSGSHLNISADVRIQVAGTLEVNDTIIDSSLQPIGAGNTGGGLWDGIVIDAGGILRMDNVSISNARTAVAMSGTATILNSIVENSYVGFDIDGQMNATNISCQDIDISCLMVSGTATVLGFSATNVSTGVSLSGHLSLIDGLVTTAGTGFDISGGSGLISDTHVDSTSTGWRVRGATSVASGLSTSSNVGLLVDAGASSGFAMSFHSGDADRVLYADGVTDLQLTNVTANTEASDTTAIDVRNDGTLTLTNLNLNNYSSGFELRGTGTTSLIGISSSTTDSAVIASGSGTLAVSTSSLHSEGDIGRFSQISTTFTSTDLSGGMDTETGLAWTGGSHILNDVDISRTYIASDTESQGLDAWWSDLTMSNVNLSGWHISAICDRCTMEGNGLQMYNGGTGNGYGLEVSDGIVALDDIATTHMTTAAILLGESNLVVASWAGETHNTLVEVSEESIAQVRSISITDMTGTIAYGDGEMHWGSDDIFTVATSSSEQYLETTVNVTDLEGTPVSAIVNVGPWEEVTDGMGQVTIPLFAGGSYVTASSGGAGAAANLQGGITNQVIQLPIIPVGDWNIATGSDVVLGPKPDGSSHILSGNLTISSGSTLTLTSTVLEFPSDKTLTIESGATLVGIGGMVTGAEYLSASGGNALAGQGDGLHISIPTIVDCSSTVDVNGIYIVADVTVASGCDYTITVGEVLGQVHTLSSDARLEVRNTLTVVVIDAGNPVEGALVSVGGTSIITDVDGIATAVETVRLDMNGSETEWTYWKYVQVQRGGHIQFYNWTLNESLTHTFISSTVNPELFDEYMLLEAEWSPWYLNSDLTIPDGSDIEIRDNAEVVIADGVEITVEGSMSIGSATLHSTSGSRWSGIVVTETGTLETSGSHLVEASQIVTVSNGGSVAIINTELARGDTLLSINGESTTQVDNSNFHDAMESCVMAQGIDAAISISDTTLTACGDHAIWARYAMLDIENIELGNGSEEGLDFSAVTGTVNGVYVIPHEDTNSTVHLSEIDGGLTVSNLNLVPGASSAALSAEMSRDINIDSVQITGAPAVELEFVAGTVSNLQLTGDGAGTGISAHHSRGSGALEISESLVSGYSVALDLHANPGEIYNPRLILSENIFSGSTAISSDGRSFVSIDDTISGLLEITSDVSMVCDLYDSTYADITVYGNATVFDWRTMSFLPTLDGLPVTATVTVTSPISEEFGVVEETYTSQHSAAPSTVVPFAAYDSDTASDMNELSISATAEGGLPFTMIFNANSTMAVSSLSNIPLSLTLNSNPILQLMDPDGDTTLMQTQNLSFSANATDINTPKSSLDIVWTITDSTGAQVMSSDEWSWWTDELQVGNYVGKVTVMDPHGGVSDTSFIITVTQLDSDGDWGVNCDQNLWWDSEAAVDCGPDDLDDDDDNDGIDDVYDAWPNDPCATQDSDVDGMPDELRCPVDVTTNLIEDSDDDNDGISDVDEGTGANQDEVSMSTVAAVLLFIAIAALVINRMRVQ